MISPQSPDRFEQLRRYWPDFRSAQFPDSSDEELAAMAVAKASAAPMFPGLMAAGDFLSIAETAQPSGELADSTGMRTVTNLADVRRRRALATLHLVRYPTTREELDLEAWALAELARLRLLRS